MLANKKIKNQQIDQTQRIFRICCKIFVLTVLFRIGVSGKVNLANPELSAKYEQKLQLEKSVADLQYENLELSSISKVSQKARELGFVPYNKGLISLNVTVGVPIAANTVR